MPVLHSAATAHAKKIKAHLHTKTIEKMSNHLAMFEHLKSYYIYYIISAIYGFTMFKRHMKKSLPQLKNYEKIVHILQMFSTNN